MKTKITLILFLLGTFAVRAQLITATGSMSVQRTGHTSQLLNNGKVLVCGGNNFNYNNYISYNSAELYSNGSWTATGSMKRIREDCTSALLSSGSVLVMGGAGRSCEIYNSNTGNWSYTDSLSFSPYWSNAVMLDNNKILLVSKLSLVTELYDQNTNTWSITGELKSELFYTFGLTKLPNGNVLLTGGETQTAQLYDAVTGTWKNVEALMLEFRLDTKSILMSNGKVLIVGANNTWNQSSEVFDPISNSFTSLQEIPNDHSLATMINLSCGDVLIYGIGDLFGFSNKKSLIKYSPISNAWSSAGVVPSNVFSAAEYTVNKIAGGKILFSGGFWTTGNGANAQCYLVDENNIASGIFWNSNSLAIEIYPNPNNGQFIIKQENQIKINRVEIYNILGEIVFAINSNPQQSMLSIDLSDSPKGLYMGKIYDGKNTYTCKIVKQ